jgi:HEAT repeat protein
VLVCGLILLSGVADFASYLEAMPNYVRQRLLKQRMPVRQWAERLSDRDAPLRPEMASMMAVQAATPDDAVAIPQLAGMLEDSVPSVRTTAASTLQTLITISPAGQRGAPLDAETEACLVRAVSSSDPYVRQIVSQIMRGRPQNGPRNMEAVGSAEVKRLIALVNGPDAQRRREAFAALSSIGPPASPAIPSLEAHLNEGAVDDRIFAALALSHIDPNSVAAINFLGNALTAPQQSPQFRMFAAQRLGELGPAARTSVPKFLEAWDRRMITIEAAGFLHRIDSAAAARARIPHHPVGAQGRGVGAPGGAAESSGKARG